MSASATESPDAILNSGRWRSVVLAAVLPLSAGMLGCDGQEQGAGELNPQEEQALADTIATVNQKLAAAWSELEPEAYLELVSDDIRFYYQGWYDRTAYEQLVRKVMAGHRSLPLELVDSNIEVLGRDAAVVTGTYRAQPVDTAGRSREARDAFTFVYERRNGSWKLVRGHESIVPEQDDAEPDTVRSAVR